MNPDDVEIVRIPIEAAETGMSLAIKHEGHAILFQVENKIFEYTRESGTVWTLESEPLGDGQPLRIQGPPGTMVHRILKKR